MLFRLALLFVTTSALAQSPLSTTHVLRPEGRQSDFPSLCLDAGGTPHVAFIQWDGTQDTLHLAKLTDGSLTDVLTLGTPGIIHQPALAADASGTLHVVWSQVNDKDLMELRTARVRDGKIQGDITTLSSSPNGGNAFAKSATDSAGNVWVVWQSMRGSLGDIFCCVFKKDAWSGEIQVTQEPSGEWEPCIAFDPQGGAWICHDSSRGNEFNIYATHLSSDLKVGETRQLIATSRYEGRINAATAQDGKGVWLACERGNEQWGLDMRAHGGQVGLNGRRDLVIAYWDLATGKVEELPGPDVLLKELPAPKAPAAANPPPRANNPKARAKAEERAKNQAAQAKAKGKPAPNEVGAVNLPHLMLDAAGRPWLTVRFFKNFCWQIALTRYDSTTRQWTRPFLIPDSVYTQDRQTTHALGKDGSLWLAWSTDLRTTKLQLTTGIHLAKIATDAPLPLVTAPAVKPREPFAEYINETTPERDRNQRHTWTHNGVTYKLFWGDYHRHTDISNCVTANDGCVLEQYRYAWDMGKLDTLGLSDHTDIAKIYHPYEWWLNQKMTEIFYSPGFFMSMYAYEREQKWPLGHRNVIFAQRGGPIVYIERKHYLDSPWQKTFPVKTDGPAELHPTELWDVLARYGKPVTAISHTGATSMGTDWDQMPPVDHRIENVVEIYQGARVSYEGLNVPQPTVGMRKGQPYNHASTVVGTPVVGQPIRSFTEKNNGVYQHVLELGHKLGVWADSDHISTHTSYGGVYVKDFTREGIIEGIAARRTIAATDKIFVEFSCNDHLMGTEIALSGKPVLKFSIDGTAEITRVTLVRNEKNYQQWEVEGKAFTQTYTDEEPLQGENRYYLRVEQSDGNMAWSSPVWVQVK